MDKVAVALWVLTAAGGFYMFGFTLRSGSRTADAPGTHFSSTLFWHPVGAVAGLALLLLFLGPAPVGFLWASFVVLVLTAVFGSTFAHRWWQDRRTLEHPEELAEQHIPLAVVLVHGVLALALLAAVLVAALQA
jgi:hypothetical protein